MSNFGHNRERQIKALMEAEGWIVIRSPASLGLFDLMMMKLGEKARVVECKATAAGPYHGFSPSDRIALIEVAEKAGAEAWLAFWPKRGQLQWIPAHEWPEVTATNEGENHAD